MSASNSGGVVTTLQRDRLLIITLNRPDQRNAVNGEVAEAIEAAIDRLEADEGLAAGVLAASGSVFCAGADLKEIAAGRMASLATARGGFAGLTTRDREKPLVAAVHGSAFAGGFEVVLACDLIVAAENAQFGLPEVKRSLVALAGGLIMLPRFVGEKLALEMALTGEPQTARRLYDAGLISRLVPLGESVLDAATSLAGVICENGPLAVRASRRIVLGARNLSVPEHWPMSFEVGLPVFASQDAAEGPRAFIEKRKPVWKGR